jgi:cardiolipin synthase
MRVVDARRWALGAAFLLACSGSGKWSAPDGGGGRGDGDAHGDGDDNSHGDGDTSAQGDGDQPGHGDGDAHGDGGAPITNMDGGSAQADAGHELDAGHAPHASLVGFYNNAAGVPLEQLIDSAQNTLDIEIYQMYDSAVHTAIRRALQRNVKVRLVQEPSPVGDSCKPFAAGGSSSACSSLKQLISDIEASGGQAVPFNKSQLCTSNSCVEHGKLMIADGKLALVSTGNFNNTSLCDLADSPSTCDRDFSTIIDDAKVIATLQSVFEHDLAGVRYDLAPLIDTTADTLTVSPLSRAPLTAFLKSAQKSLRIANQYLNDSDLNAAITEVAKRGVKVQVMVSSFCWFATPSASEKSKAQSTFSAFDAAGVKSRTFTGGQLINGQEGYLHAKVIVVDDTRAWVGSVNGSSAALGLNREFGLFFANADWLATLVSTLDADFADPNSETWQESLDCKKDR